LPLLLLLLLPVLLFVIPQGSASVFAVACSFLRRPHFALSLPVLRRHPDPE
jgi:hypothetical protein